MYWHTLMNEEGRVIDTWLEKEMPVGSKFTIEDMNPFSGAKENPYMIWTVIGKNNTPRTQYNIQDIYYAWEELARSLGNEMAWMSFETRR